MGDEEIEEIDELDDVDEVELRAGFGIVQCLPVDDDDDDDEVGPSDGMATTVEAYLRQVRRQARALPDVVTAKTPDGAAAVATQQAKNDSQEHDRDRKPSMAWIRSFLSYFASLRAELQRVRECTGDSLHASNESRCLLALSDRSLLNLGQVRLHQMLEVETDAIDLNGIAAERVKRVYEILALLDWPCHSDTLATMSRLVRTCSRRRSAPTRPEDAELAHLNIIIAICGGIFRQDKELAGIILAET